MYLLYTTENVQSLKVCKIAPSGSTTTSSFKVFFSEFLSEYCEFITILLKCYVAFYQYPPLLYFIAALKKVISTPRVPILTIVPVLNEKDKKTKMAE